MIRQSYEFHVITPCFCGGARPAEEAEIRVASVRGQLRWWFRVLEGFQSLAARMNVRQQEDLIFGTTAGGQGKAGKLRLWANPIEAPQQIVDDNAMNAGPRTDAGDLRYLLFPLHCEREGTPDEKRHDRAVIRPPSNTTPLPGFTLHLQWRGDTALAEDLVALITVFGNLGALGFRSRRAMGALAFKDFPYPIREALKRFKGWNEPTQNSPPIALFEVQRSSPFSSASQCITELAKWLRLWRQHGQMRGSWKWRDRKNHSLGADWVPVPVSQSAANRAQPGFKFARRDHNEGLNALKYPVGSVPANTAGNRTDPEQPHGQPGTTFRPALGLPIIQFFSSLGSPAGPAKRNLATVNWTYENDGGRFASPVLLRPHRAADGSWHALVIFVNALQWPSGQKVYLNGSPCNVSLDLFDAMKRDLRHLKRFV